MTSDVVPAVRRFLRLRPRLPRPVAADPAMNETTVDLTHTALQARMDVAENRLLSVECHTQNLLAHLAERRRWSGMTHEQLLGAVKSELFEVYLIATGKAKS